MISNSTNKNTINIDDVLNDVQIGIINNELINNKIPAMSYHNIFDYQ